MPRVLKSGAKHAVSDCFWVILPRWKGLGADALAAAWEYEYTESGGEVQQEACHCESDTCTHFDICS